MEDEVVNDKALKRQRIIDEDRHKQQMGVLKGIATLLNKPEKDDKQIVEAIKKQGEALDKVVAAIQNQPKPEKPEVNVAVDNKEILPLLREIKEGNDSILAALEKKLYVDSFKVINTGSYGNEKTINVIYKPMNQVTIKK